MPQYVFTFSQRHESDWHVIIHCLREQGNLDIGTSVSPVLIQRRPNIAIMAGIAGSLDPTQVTVGDVVVSTGAKMMAPDAYKTLDPSRERFSDDASRVTPVGGITVDFRDRLMLSTFMRQRRRWLDLENSHTALSLYLSGLKKQPLSLQPIQAADVEGQTFSNAAPKVVGTTIFGSDFVIDSDEYVRLIRERNADRSTDYYVQKNDPLDMTRLSWRGDDLLAVDMESFGFFLAHKKANIGAGVAFAVRGISDHATKKTHLDLGSRGSIRGIAASNATAVALDLARFLRVEHLGSAGGRILH